MRPAPAKKRRGKNRRPLKAATLRRLRSQNWKHGRRAGPAGIAAHYLTELYAPEPGLEAAMQNKKLVRKLVTLKTPEERGAYLRAVEARRARRVAQKARRSTPSP
jgi:hypothetical protein